MKIGIITDKESEIFKKYPILFEYFPQKYNIYIGYTKTKTIKDISILSHQIDKFNWWVFSEKEKPTDFNKIFLNVLKDVIKNISQEYEYKVIDPIINKITKEQLHKFLSSKNFDYYLKDGRMIYLYYNKFIYGFDIEVFNWIGWSLRDLINFKETKPFIVDELYNNLFSQKDKKFIPIFIN